MLYVGKYPQIYPHTILGLGNVSRDGLPLGTLPSGIFKLEKYCPGLKVRHPADPKLYAYEYYPELVLVDVNFCVKS